MEQCGETVWNSGTVWWNSVEQHGGKVWHNVAQCGGTVWNGMVEDWNGVSSVGQCGGTLEQCW